VYRQGADACRSRAEMEEGPLLSTLEIARQPNDSDRFGTRYDDPRRSRLKPSPVALRYAFFRVQH
jgi:hypothetical protein